MEGQGSSNATNPGLDQQNLDSENASSLKGKSVMNCGGQSSSSVNTQSQITHVPLPSADEHAPSGTRQRFRGTPNENGEVTNGQPLAQETIASALPSNIDLNATYQGNSNDSSQEMGADVSLNPSKSGGETKQNPPGSDPTNPVVISSGISGYVVEENDGRQGNTSNGRRISCKRREPESSSGPLFLKGASSSSAQQALTSQENSGSSSNVLSALTKLPNAGHLGHLNAGVRVGNQTPTMNTLWDSVGADTFSRQSSSVAANGLEGGPAMHQTSNVAGNGAGFGAATGTNYASMWGGQSDDLQRNIRLRRNENRQFLEPDYMSVMNSFMGYGYPTDRFHDPYDELQFGRRIPALELPPMHPMLQAPDSFQSRYGSQVARASGSSESSAQAVNGGNLSLMAANMNPNFPGNASNSNGRSPLAPTWFNNPSMGDLYSNRYAETGSGSESRGWGRDGYTARELENSVRGGILRPSHGPFRPRFMTRVERPGVADLDISPTLRTLSPAALRRSMLISGVENALALVRRTGALRFEDMMGIDRRPMWIREGGNEEDDDDEDEDEDEDDVLEDLRLDTDNMSYEELLALEERIGNVNTGLNEEAILALLRQRKHQSVPVESPVYNEPCCVCQEEYADGEDLGKLDCGHEYHANCIKQWLKRKNVCPICKLPGLSGKKREH
ncbi:hypothetical protein Pint_28017 [Pistacia integerrima]|uniref:Uncharacterized protein n=1 Tax=Pistacia integerrima TaxID=434235 RepID=A0ACC0YRX1_9ROSI|nr:hypothetical protein Pint_28017 [Pistacia integerrima]